MHWKFKKWKRFTMESKEINYKFNELRIRKILLLNNHVFQEIQFCVQIDVKLHFSG